MVNGFIKMHPEFMVQQTKAPAETGAFV